MTNTTSSRQEREDYVDWKRSQAAKADALTQRAATRAKQLLNLMIQLGHYDPERHNVTTASSPFSDDEDREASLFDVGKCEPGMRPNCYTYSAVMNALAKSCSALRVMTSSPSSNNNSRYRSSGGTRREPRYDPAREAQDMLESMIEKHERYKERVGETDLWKNSGYARSSPNDDYWLEEEEDDEDYDSEEDDEDDEYDGSNSSYQKWMEETSPSSTADGEENSHWFEPRPDELTFPPNTINYNSVLNAWSRASRYDPYSAIRAEKILVERMERPLSEGGDAVEPDALSYSLVIHAWLRGCRGNSGPPSPSSFRPRKRNFTDEERIHKSIEIVDRLEAWARKSHAQRNRIVGNGDDGDGDEFTSAEDDFEEDDDYNQDDNKESFSRSTSYTFRQHNKARDLDVEVYNSILVAFSREQSGDHAASVMKLLDRMEKIADELDMPSVRPNQRSYNIALDVIAKSAMISKTSLARYYKEKELVTDKPSRPGNHHSNPLYAGRAAESILTKMLARDFRPDAYTFASVLNTYQRIPNGKLDAALAADAVVRGMESLHLHGKIDQPPDVFHYTMVCACWSRSGEQGVAGERCSEILRHMHQRDKAGFQRVRPNIRTYNAVIDSHAYNGRVAEAEDMLLSMVDNYESSAERAMDGIDDEELPVRPDSFSFNTVIQQWARSRTPDGGRRAERILDRMLEFHHSGNADVRPDERSFAYIIYHYTKGAGRLAPDAPDRALKLLRRMIGMYRQGYKDLMPSHQNRTNPIFAFTSVIDAHSVLRRNDSGIVGAELFESMTKLGEKIESLRPNTYACMSVLYGWSSCGSVDSGERATELLRLMEADMKEAASRGEESTMKTTQRCYILAQTAWARSQSERKASGALEVLNMMEKNYAEENLDAKPTVQAYSMVLNACAFADTVDVDGNIVKASRNHQMKAFQIAELIMGRLSKEPYPNVKSTSMTYGTFIKCCGRLDLPHDLSEKSASKAFADCCKTGYVSDFVFTQLRYALPPEKFLKVLVENGYKNLNSKGKSLSRDGKRIRHVRLDDLPEEWRRCVDRSSSKKSRR